MEKLHVQLLDFRLFNCKGYTTANSIKQPNPRRAAREFRGWQNKILVGWTGQGGREWGIQDYSIHIWIKLLQISSFKDSLLFSDAQKAADVIRHAAMNTHLSKGRIKPL